MRRAAQFPRAEVDVASTDLSLPGPAGQIPARHYRPKVEGGRRAAAGLLPRRRVRRRRLRNPRQPVRDHLPRGRRPRAVRRLPAGARAQGASRRRRRVRGISLGRRPRRRTGRRPEPGRRRRGQRGRQSRRGGGATRTRRRRAAAGPAAAALSDHQLRRTGPGRWACSPTGFSSAAGTWTSATTSTSRVRASIRPIRGCRRCWPTTCPGCRPPFSSRRASTRCADEGRQYAEALSRRGQLVDAREFGSLIHAFANFFDPRRRQRDGDRRHHFGPARTSQPQLTNRREPRRYP